MLLDADLPLLRRYDGPAEVVSFADRPDEAAIVADLLERGPARPALWLVSDPAAAPITAAQLRDVLASVGPPVSTATVGSAVVTQYTYRNPPTVRRRSPRATFGPDLALVDALVSDEAPFAVYLRWTTPTPPQDDLWATLYLLDGAGYLWAETGQVIVNAIAYPTSAWRAGEWSDLALALAPPVVAPPGEYAVQLTVGDERTGAQRGAWDAAGQFLGVRVPLGTVTVAPPEQPVGPLPCDGREAAWGIFRACLPAQTGYSVPSGDLLSLGVEWCAAAAPAADRRVTWRLRAGGGDVGQAWDAPLSPYPTSRWRAGDCFRSLYDLRLDPLVPAGTYTLTLGLDGEAVAVAGVEILPRERLFDLPDEIAHPLDLTLGEVLHLRGFDLDRAQATPGGTLPLTLYWQADGPADLDYTVFVHLVGPDGAVHGQVDRPPGGGAAPTSSLAPGQVIVDALTLPVAGDAPPGVYRIAVGLYDPFSGGR
ncbi:MAG TPA: hypothetical protein ENK17_00745, partial [Anaerolineae bacterium]|nr:hypothetical protein [Anaerolineae bacterium]